MILGFADRLRELIREDLNALADSMANGAPKNFPEYTGMVGQVRGLATAEMHLLQLIQAYEEMENDGG